MHNTGKEAADVMRKFKVRDDNGGNAFLHEYIIEMIANMVGGRKILPPQTTSDTLKEKMSLFQPKEPSVGDVVGDGKPKVNTPEPPGLDAAMEHKIRDGGGAGSGRSGRSRGGPKL